MKMKNNISISDNFNKKYFVEDVEHNLKIINSCLIYLLKNFESNSYFIGDSVSRIEKDHFLKVYLDNLKDAIYNIDKMHINIIKIAFRR